MDDISLLEQQANSLMSSIEGWEQSVLTRIAKRINKIGKMSVADVKYINKILMVKQDMDAIIKGLAKITGKNISQIEKIYGDLISEQHLNNKVLFDFKNKEFIPFEDNKKLQAIVRAFSKKTCGDMLNLSNTKMFCIRDEKGRFVKMRKGYAEILDKAIMQVATGATDFDTAMRDTVSALGGGGVRVDYGGGITRRLDTVVRQNLLYGAKQCSIEYNNIIAEELGCDGYEIDAHSNPRPSHEFMQGKQYCIGESREINGVWFVGFEDADPESPQGLSASRALNDYGCLHFKTPIVCGVSKSKISKSKLKRIKDKSAREYTIGNQNGNGYFWTQRMRAIETAIREQKSIKQTAQASGDEFLVAKCNERIKAYRKKYDEISEITGISKEIKRMFVPKTK